MSQTQNLLNVRSNAYSDMAHHAQSPTMPAPKSQTTTAEIDRLEVGETPKKESLINWKNLIDLEMDLNTIEKGTLRISVPLKADRYQFPGIYKNANVQIAKGTHALLSLAIDRDSAGEAVIAGANIEINPPLRIKNPASAFQPPRKVANAFRDLFADIVLRGIGVTQEGRIVLDGFLSKGIFGNDDIKKHFDNTRFPKLDLKLNSILGLTKSPSTSPGLTSIFGDNWNLSDVLHQVGAMTERATYSLQLTSDPVSIGVGPKDLRVWTEKSPLRVNLQGRAKLTEAGELELANDQLDSTLASNNTNVNIGIEAVVKNLTGQRPTVLAHIGMRTDLKEFQGVISDEKKIAVPFSAGGQGNFVSSHTFLTSDENGSVAIKDASSLMVNIDASIPTRAPIHVAPLSVSVEKGSMHLEGGINFSAEEKMHIHDGAVDLGVTGANAQIEIAGFKGALPGELSGRIKARHLQKKSTDLYPSFQGEVAFHLKPSEKHLREVPELRPFERTLDYRFKADATLSLNPRSTGVTEFLSPFTDLVWSPEWISNPKTPAAGALGSKAWQEKVEEVTGAKILPNNRVELLVDGVQSYPKRLELIESARRSICVQTLIFKDDKTGIKTAEALIAAKKRGVDVFVIVDSLGNIDSLNDIVEGNKIYSMLRENGVHFKLYGGETEQGLREIMQVVVANEQLQLESLKQLLDPKNALRALHLLASAAKGTLDLGLDSDDRMKLLTGIAKIWGGKRGMSPEDAVNHLASLSEDNILELSEVVQIVKQMAEFHHRWHEKYLIVDGKKAIVGGMNISDEYLLGGTGEQVKVLGKTRTAWRDTDILVEGPAAAEAYEHFSNNWESLSGKRLEVLNPQDLLPVTKEHGEGTNVQMVQSRPRDDGDHHITNFMIEGFKALQKGEKAYLANAYFLPTGALEGFEQTLMDAVARGVDVRIVTNSGPSSDLPQLNQAAICSTYRKLLNAGVRIFERFGDRTMHTKACSLGSQVAVVGSWNADNRSASLNSECVAIVHDKDFGQKVENMIVADMDESVAKELHLSDIEFLPAKKEIENSAVAMLNDLM